LNFDLIKNTKYLIIAYNIGF